MVSKHGNSLVVESQEGVRYSQNTSHCKKCLQNCEDPLESEINTELHIPTTAKEVDTELINMPNSSETLGECEITVQSHEDVQPRGEESVSVEPDRSLNGQLTNLSIYSKNIPLRRSEWNRRQPSYLKDCT